MLKAWAEGWEKYLEFRGRSTRLALVAFVVGNVALLFLLSAIELVLGWTGVDGGGPGPLRWAFLVAAAVPALTVQVRRWHDLGRTGWWAVLAAVPGVNLLVIVYLAVADSQPGLNRYGPNPKGVRRRSGDRLSESDSLIS